MSYDFNFWNEETPLKLSAEKIYHRLSAGKTVKGLANLPVAEIVQRLKTLLPGYDPDKDSAVSLKNGSIEVSYSDQSFRFDMYGHVPIKTKEALISLMAEYGCPLYDPQLDERHELGKQPKFGRDVEDVKKFFESLGAKFEFRVVPKPATLQPATEEMFSDSGWLRDLTRQALQCGYEHVGDFRIPESMVCFRLFFQKPNVYVSLNAHAYGICWSEIIVYNADDTTETWTSWAPDEHVAPWNTRVVRKCPLLDLHDMMKEGHSGKPPSQLSVEEFPALFQEAVSRITAWRKTLVTSKPPSA